jgi:hypothetical protein
LKTNVARTDRIHNEIVANLEADLRNPYVQAFLSTIAQAEGATYNTRYGGGTFSDDRLPASHTDETSHAAIYLRQDAEGIYVIEQWNMRDGGHMVGRRAPASPAAMAEGAGVPHPPPTPASLIP